MRNTLITLALVAVAVVLFLLLDRPEPTTDTPSAPAPVAVSPAPAPATPPVPVAPAPAPVVPPVTPEVSASAPPAAPSPAPAPPEAPATKTDPARVVADAPVEVLEKAPARLLAETLANSDATALKEVDAQTLADISDEIDRLNARRDTAKEDSEARPTVEDRLVKRTEDVQVLKLPALSAPTELPSPGAGSDAARTAAEGAGDADEPRRSILTKVLQAPASLLEELPRPLLARALAELPEAALEPSMSGDVTRELPAAIEAASADVQLDREARAFIAELTRERVKPIDARTADNFVLPGQRLSLLQSPDTKPQSARAMLDAGAALDTPVSVVRITHRLEPLNAAELMARADNETTQPIRILEREKVVEIPVVEALERLRLKPTERITLVREVEYLEPTTLGELRRAGELDGAVVPKVVAGPTGISQKTLDELLGLHKSDNPDTVYYVRTVRSEDVQGIWGIIQWGLIDNFAKGMSVRTGTLVSTYKVTIPRLADEMVDNNTRSSFLGRMLFEKTRRSALYNIHLGRITRSPESLKPGQQIVIVDFSPDELVSIYRHFAAQQAASGKTS